MHIVVESSVPATPRVLQVRGMFDLPAASTSRLEWQADLPLDERPWHIGLIVGPSGSGKSTVLRHLFPGGADHRAGREEAAVVDAFPEGMSIRDIAALLSAVGFASPPAWLRPVGVLSTGQRFRVELALLLAVTPPGEVAVCDEFTSVVDRTVARVGSAALAKLIRRTGRKFVAATCHEDVVDWLQPDWTYRPAENAFAWRRLRRRPAVVLDLERCRPAAWPLFAPHHYLSGRLHPSATCFLARWEGRPVAFSAWLPYVGQGPPARREHRTVVLPDYQGIGIGRAVADFVASLWRGLGYRARSTTTHPGLIRSRLASPWWRLVRPPAFARGGDRRLRHAATRLTAGFEYVGPAAPPALGRAFGLGNQ